jgi:hypothetical protein
MLRFLLLTCLLLAGCERQSSNGPAETGPVPSRPQTVAAVLPVHLLKEPVEATMVEIATEALPIWRRFHEQRPALVVLAESPFARAVPTPLQGRAGRLTEDGDAYALWAASPFATSDPVLLPEMAVRAALRAGFFSRLIWVIPVPEEVQGRITVEDFRRNLQGDGTLTVQEADSIERRAVGFAGTLEGVPFLAIFPETLPTIDGPIVLHLDAGFVSPFYKNEVKTPLFPLIHKHLTQLRDADWQVLAVTISRSNFGARLPVEVRFLAPIFSRLLKEPDMLEGEMPAEWILRRDNLYLESFFQPEKMLANARRMIELAPGDAAAYFDLYAALVLDRRTGEAMDALAMAVLLDPAYALKYLQLAEAAGDNPVESLILLERAAAALPEEPLIPLLLAERLLKAGRAAEAETLLHYLARRNWSQTYFPDMARHLTALREKAAAKQAGR